MLALLPWQLTAERFEHCILRRYRFCESVAERVDFGQAVDRILDAADRKSKGVWAAMLGGSAAFLAFPMIGWMMLGIPIIASLVITGIYWLDVRPQIRGILDNAQGGW